jgi:hypothetical protein
MSATPTVASVLKAAAVATAVIPLLWGLLYTPVGVLFFLLIDGFVVGPLQSLGWVDPGQQPAVIFYGAFALIAILVWLCFFRLSFRLFKASAERKARIAEEEYE